ncbi:T9SS type A sorting domain-containing protein [Psychroserpens burtonensis]|uniref:T9SS type A sorting domain-containing protein n=1 Tax=Psychroserpens burtonensis TaxID=49278 RepID=A0A5C7BFU2_9FLAO|nr:PQQ-dependent sugar dehydrogenase [Psychroserpens burtonensis]TXE17426.1 T9SS type A sorting domain-containing protein [Psychroserpens burtonensis]
MKKITFLITCCFVSLTFAQDISLEPFATGLSNPVNIKHAGDDRLFVAERDGRIKVMNTDGSINPTNFLDIDGRVTDFGGEQGLLAMAFHPNYASNGYFYVNYIDNNGDTVIARFTRSSADIADPNSEVVLLSVVQPFGNHNGGDMHFGPEGYLYISLGDGGAADDPGNRAQSLNTLLGKMLRIDVDATDMGNYGIPADNPFVGNSAALNEIWSYGLRNTWKFSFDKTTGDLWTADVGQNQIEEINKALASSTGGENYGWKCFEGNSIFSSQTSCNTITHEAPVAQYTHSSTGGCSITGGYVYRGTTKITLQGLYFFADFCSDDIGYVQETTPGNYDISFIEDLSGLGISAFGEDFDGELYVVSLFQGAIFKLNEVDLSIDNQSISNIKMYPNPAKTILTFASSNASNQIESITIHDTQGQLIVSHSNFEKHLITIPTEFLTIGVYIVQISNKRGDRSVRKLIVE